MKFGFITYNRQVLTIELETPLSDGTNKLVITNVETKDQKEAILKKLISDGEVYAKKLIIEEKVKQEYNTKETATVEYNKEEKDREQKSLALSRDIKPSKEKVIEWANWYGLSLKDKEEETKPKKTNKSKYKAFLFSSYRDEPDDEAWNKTSKSKEYKTWKEAFSTCDKSYPAKYIIIAENITSAKKIVNFKKAFDEKIYEIPITVSDEEDTIILLGGSYSVFGLDGNSAELEMGEY